MSDQKMKIGHISLSLATHALFLIIIVLFNFGQFTSILQVNKHRQELTNSSAEIVASKLNTASWSKNSGQILRNIKYYLSGLQQLHVIAIPRDQLKVSYSPGETFTSEATIQNCGISYLNISYPTEICAAVPLSTAGGAFLYIVAKFIDTKIAEHVTGAIPKLEEHIEITIQHRTKKTSKSYQIVFQKKKSGISGNTDTYQAIAYIDYQTPAPGGQNGVAGSLIQQSGMQYFIVRIPYSIFDNRYNDSTNMVSAWPPSDIQDITVGLSRYKKYNKENAVVVFSNTDKSNGDVFGRPRGNIQDIRTIFTDMLQDGARIRFYDHERNAVLVVTKEMGYVQLKDPSHQDIVSQDYLQSTVFPFNWFFKVTGYGDNPATSKLIDTPFGGYISLELGETPEVTPDRALLKSIFINTLIVDAAIFFSYFAIAFLVLRRIRMLADDVNGVTSTLLSDHSKVGTIKFVSSNNELGILARSFAELIAKVKATMRAEEQRLKSEAAQRESTLLSLGHEIRSPLQALIALGFNSDGQPAKAYVDRMSRAVNHLMGHGASDNNISNVPLQIEPMDISNFFRLVTENAHYQGISNVELYIDRHNGIKTLADSIALEDMVTHILRNAERYKSPGSPIQISISTTDHEAIIKISNDGPHIPENKLEEIFEFGVSDGNRADGNLGQGLFISRNYANRMNGSIIAKNLPSKGVMFEIHLPLADR